MGIFSAGMSRMRHEYGDCNGPLAFKRMRSDRKRADSQASEKTAKLLGAGRRRPPHPKGVCYWISESGEVIAAS